MKEQEASIQNPVDFLDIDIALDDSEDTTFVNENEDDSSELDEDTSKNRKSSRKKREKESKSKPTTKRERKSLIPEEHEKIVVEFCKMKCEICSIEFPDSYLEMKQHYTKEHQARGYVTCCSRKFYKFCRIFDHVQHHLNPNVFQCDICLKSYTEKWSLINHKKTHNKTSVSCTYEGCDKVYTTNHQLKAHIKKKHEIVVEQLECDFCSKM